MFNEYSFQHLIRLTRVMAVAEAAAAPAIPKGGIKLIFKPTLRTAVAAVAHIINRDSPMAIKVAAFGPRKLLMIYPSDNILSALAACAYCTPKRKFSTVSGNKNKIRNKGNVIEQSHLVKIEKFLLISAIEPCAYTPEITGM